VKTRLSMAVLVLLAGLLVLASGCINVNVRPVALFTVDRVDGLSPLTVNFDGSGSYDSDGTIEAYSWNFGDGASETGVTTSHTFGHVRQCGVLISHHLRWLIKRRAARPARVPLGVPPVHGNRRRRDLPEPCAERRRTCTCG